MILYKKTKPLSIVATEPSCVIRLSDNACIPFAPDNTDYATFKADILADKATLQDADGNLMTAEQAKEFVATLP